MSDFQVVENDGFTIKIKLSHSLVERIIDSRDIIDCLMTGGGAALVALGTISAPVVAVIAACIKLQLLLIKRMDRRNGVYLTSVGFGVLSPGRLIWIPASA